MDEKELIPGTGPEETVEETIEETVEEPVEETVEDTVEETEENVVLAEEEIDEETEEILAEQDALDGDPAEQEPADPLDVALELALGQDVLDLDEVVGVRTKVNETGKALEKAKATVKKLGTATVCLAVALVLSLAAVAGLWFKGKGEAPFAGLEVGKSYESNISLPDYTKLTYKDSYVEPTEKDLQSKIQDALVTAKKTTEEDVKDALIEGDVTTLDFDGFVDGAKLDSACGTDQELELGSGKFIPGFEEGLVGKKVGEKVTLDLAFPKDYSEASLQGKKVRFDVTIKAAKRTVYPALTDALVSEITEKKYATVDAYQKGLMEELKATARSEADSAARNDVWTALAEQTTLKKYPDNMYNYYVEKLDEQYKNYYATYGVNDLEGFMAAQKMDLDTYVKNQMVYEFSIYTIAAKQGLTLGDEDYATMLKNYGCATVDELVQKLGVEPFELEASLLYSKVTDYLMEVAVAE